MQQMRGWILTLIALAVAAPFTDAQEAARAKKRRLRVYMRDGVMKDGVVVEKVRYRVLWVSQDEGRSWQPVTDSTVTLRNEVVTDTDIYAKVEVPDDGSYAFYWQNGKTMGSLTPAPRPGQWPSGVTRVFVDTQPPQVTAAIDMSSVRVSRQIRINIEAKDNDRLARFILWVKKAVGWTARHDVEAQNDAQGRFFLISVAGEGTSVFAVQAIDAAGNVSDEEPFEKPGSTVTLAAPGLWISIREHQVLGRHVRLYYRTDARVDPDTLRIWWTTDNGATWASLETTAGSDRQGTFVEGDVPADGQYGFTVTFTDIYGSEIPAPMAKAIPALGSIEVGRVSPTVGTPTERPADIARARRAYHQARWMFAQDKIKEAIAHLEEALEYWNNYPEALNDLGAAYSRIQEPERALQYFLASLKVQPSNPENHFNVASAMLDLGRVDPAHSYLIDAVRLMDRPNPRLAVRLGDALMGVARVHYKGGRKGNAVEAAGWVHRIRGVTKYHREASNTLLTTLRED